MDGLLQKNSRRPAQALGYRHPMSVWRERRPGLSASETRCGHDACASEKRRALTTRPQPKPFSQKEKKSQVLMMVEEERNGRVANQRDLF